MVTTPGGLGQPEGGAIRLAAPLARPADRAVGGEARHFGPVDRDLAAPLGGERQLVGRQVLDRAGQSIAVAQHHRVGQGKARGANEQQGSQYPHAAGRPGRGARTHRRRIRGHSGFSGWKGPLIGDRPGRRKSAGGRHVEEADICCESGYNCFYSKPISSDLTPICSRAHAVHLSIERQPGSAPAASGSVVLPGRAPGFPSRIGLHPAAAPVPPRTGPCPASQADNCRAARLSGSSRPSNQTASVARWRLSHSSGEITWRKKN